MFFIQIGIVYGHQPDLSSLMLVEKDSQHWILQLKASMTAFEYVIHKQYGTKSYTTPEEFNAMVIEYTTKHISILSNNNIKISLINSLVNLGHETSVMFDLDAIPTNIHQLEVQNTCFKDIPHNKCALIILKKEVLKNQFILNNDNLHTANVELTGNTFQIINQKSSFIILSMKNIITMVCLSFLSVGLLLWKVKKKVLFN